LLNPNPDLLLYTAIGDAYCLATEYIKSPEDDWLKERALKFEKYLKHPRHGLVAGTYTDDTHMSIGNSLVLLDETYNNLAFANAWVKVFKRDPRNGYSRKFQKFLEEIEGGIEFLEKINPESNKNGAAMRAAPIGVLRNPEEVLGVATLQAAITHNTPGGRFGAQAVALMSHYALYENSPLDRDSFGGYMRYHLQDIVNSNQLFHHAFAKPWAGRVKGPEVGFVTAIAAFELLISCKTLKEILTKTIEWGGDTDSVAAIALGIGSTRLEDDLPDFMHHCLEPGSKYGAEYLKDLGKKLMEKYE
jgi:ADP-ribosylglycohydrolase